LSQHRCSSEKLLQSEKCFFALHAPFEVGFLLEEFGHWLGDMGEV
jgi:hypothetical protein